MTIQFLDHWEAILSDNLTIRQLRDIEAELLNKLSSARANFTYQETALELIREKLASRGEAPLPA